MNRFDRAAWKQFLGVGGLLPLALRVDGLLPLALPLFCRGGCGESTEEALLGQARRR